MEAQPNPVQARPLPEPDLRPLEQSIPGAFSWKPLRVEGQLPSDLRGTVIRTGPGLLERFGKRLAHSFEADGALTALRLDGNGNAEGSVRVVESPGYREEERAGRSLYGSLAPRWRRIANGLQGKGKTTGNTNVLHWQGRTFALMEGAQPVEIDHRTLETAEVVDLGGVVRGAFSAHPHRIESAKTVFNFGQVWGREPGVRLYALPDDGPARDLGMLPVPWSTMIHDFAITENYVVFCVCPAKLRLSKALTGSPDFDQYFAWDASSPAVLVVAPLSDLGAAKRIEIDARWVFHFANAFERDGQLVVDWAEYPDFGVFSALELSGELDDTEQSSLHRLVIDPKAGRLVSDELIHGDAIEFPVLPAARFGHEYGPAWYTVGKPEDGRGVARFDFQTGAFDAWRPGPGYYASEALFVPAAGAEREDQGWLVSLVYDGFARESFFAVFDADRPSAGPCAKAWLGQATPITFHGTFIPSAAQFAA